MQYMYDGKIINSITSTLVKITKPFRIGLVIDLGNIYYDTYNVIFFSFFFHFPLLIFWDISKVII